MRGGTRRRPAHRQHWAVESSLYWVMDMIPRDEECSVRTDHAPANFATLKHIAHNPIRTAPSKDSPRLMRKTAAWDDDFLASLIAPSLFHPVPLVWGLCCQASKSGLRFRSQGNSSCGDRGLPANLVSGRICNPEPRSRYSGGGVRAAAPLCETAPFRVRGNRRRPPTSVLVRPHLAAPTNQSRHRITSDSIDSSCSRMDT